MNCTTMLRQLTRVRSLTSVALVCALSLVLGACDGKAAAGATPAPGAAVADDPVPAQPPQRVVAANAAAADYLRILLPASRVALIPEQVSEYSFLDYQNEGWEHVARFPNYSAEPVLAARADLV